MHGNAFGREHHRRVKAVFETVDSIRIKPCYQIHINIIKSCTSCKVKGIVNLLYGMVSADIFKHFIIKTLRIYADAGDIMTKESIEFFLCYGVGSACLNRIFPKR